MRLQGPGRPKEFRGKKLIRADGLHQDQYEWIKKESRRRGVTKSKLLREAVSLLMEKSGVKPPAEAE